MTPEDPIRQQPILTPLFGVTLEVRITQQAVTASAAFMEAFKYLKSVLDNKGDITIVSRGYQPSRVHETLDSRQRRELNAIREERKRQEES